MPTYQYACTECGHQFEQVQSFSDDTLTMCPVCQGRLRKLFNAVGVVFKGSGFYRNDSRSTTGTSDSAASSDSGSSKESGSKESGSKESGGSKDAKASPAPAKESSSSSGSSSSGSSSGGSSSST